MLTLLLIKVSDTEFYMYTFTTARAIGGSIGMTRYKGTSPYSFDFTSYESCKMDKALFGKLWHFCVRYYSGTFYFMYDGNMCTSTDGVNFLQPNYPFFYKGAQADLYKPSFMLGGDGKIKIVHSLQIKAGYPAGFIGSAYPNSFSNLRTITQTVTAEYLSFSDIAGKGLAIQKDAYVDVFVYLSNDEFEDTRIMLFPSIRGQFKFKGLNILKGDKIHLKCFTNTRGNGVLKFQGIIIDERT